MAGRPTPIEGATPEPLVPRWAGWALVLGLVVLGLRILANVRVIDLDLFHEMALIREALTLGHLPTEDSFAYTSTRSPVVHHEWATGAVLYFVVVGLGLGAPGLAILRFLLVAGIVACCVAVARARGARSTELVLAAPLAIVLFWPGLSPVRAHLFTFLFLGILLLLMEKDRTGSPRWLLLWPPLLVVWLNMHGGFVVGTGLLGLYALERFFRGGWPERFQGGERGGPGRPEGGWLARARLRSALRKSGPAILAVACVPPLLLVNPYGVQYVRYLIYALTVERPSITEWLPLWSEPFRGAPLALFLVSLLVAAYTAWRGDGWRRLPGLLLLLAAAFFALRSVRILPIYVMVWFSYVAPALSSTPLVPVARRVWERHARPVAVLTLLVSLVALGRILQEGGLSVYLPTQGAEYRQVYPSGAVRYLTEVEFEGNLMTPFGTGAYVSWMLHPRVLVGVDSRYEVAYSVAFAEEVMGMYNGLGDWRELLSRYPTDAVLVPHPGPLDSLLVREGTSAPDAVLWLEVFRDDAYAIFARGPVADRLPRIDRRGETILPLFP
jgi:hypothetical protein